MKKYLICILIFAICICGFSGCGNSEEASADSSEVSITRKPGIPADDSDSEEADSDKELSDEGLYIVQGYNYEEEKIILNSLTYDKNYVYKYSLTTQFLDKYGDSTSSANITPGCVVTIGERLSTGALSSIQISDDVWTFTEVTNYNFNPFKACLTINDTNYRLTENTAVFSNDVVATLSDLGSEDVLTVVGLDKEVLSISITTGHGYLNLVNTDKFEGSLIYIGNKIITTVTKDMSVTIPEGTYAVTVANDGYGGTKEVEILRNEYTVLDLAELEGEGPKVCKLTISSLVEGAEIYIDGERIEAGVETEVQYGKHSLMIAVEGYDTWSRTLYVNSETANISIDPTASDTDSDSSSQSSSTDSSSSSSSSTSNENSSDTSATSGSSSANSSSTTDSNSGTNSNSSSTDTELDYLSTLSSLISTLSGSSN